MNKIIDDFTDVDMREMQMPIISVYYNTTDIPNKYAARLFDINIPTNIVAIKDTLEEIRHIIPGKFVRVSRSPMDHPTVIEVWI